MASKAQLAWRKKFAALAKARFKSVKKNKSINNFKKDSAVKGRSKKKRRSSKRRATSGAVTKRRSSTSGKVTRSRRKSGGKKFDIMSIVTTVAVSVAMVFGVTYLVNMFLNKFNLAPDKAKIAKWALMLGVPALALYFGKKYPAVQAAAITTLAFAVYGWAKTVLPVGVQTQLAGFPQAPYNPLMPENVSAPGVSGVTLVPQPLA